MATSQDTEITLGTGKMLILFFGLVVICALFFGAGFSLGKNSSKSDVAVVETGTSPAGKAGGVRPAPVKPTTSNGSSSEQMYKPVDAKSSETQLKTNDATPEPSTSQPAANQPPPQDPLVASNAPGYFVQVAAVSKQEDAEALVGALKKKQYAAFASNTATDKLFHVQVGPFTDIKDAEATRSKLISDGYNPILKK
jgi:DedD protein